MSSLAVAGRYSGLSLGAVIAGLLTTAELFVAIVLVISVVEIGLQAWLSLTVGVVYLAVACRIGVRAATKRVPVGRALVELLALDVVALPLVVGAMAM